MSWLSQKAKAAAPCDANLAGDAIAVDHITKMYGDFTAADDVSFAVKQSEIFGLLGPTSKARTFMQLAICS